MSLKHLSPLKSLLERLQIRHREESSFHKKRHDLAPWQVFARALMTLILFVKLTSAWLEYQTNKIDGLPHSVTPRDQMVTTTLI